VVDPIQVSTYVDVPVVVRPLRSVRSASREPVRLAGVTEVVGLEIDADLAAGRFTVSAPRAGTYYVPFVVSAAPQEATGVVRVDVLERPEEVEPPIAVLDRALLPPGGEVTIDPLANDVDPAGVCSWCSPSRSRRTAVCGSPSSSTSCCGSPQCGPSRGR
jgi:large repetitive protein